MGWRFAAVSFPLVASIVGVVWWQFASLPHPSVANQDQIGYWLVLRDLKEQPAEIQVALVNRLNKEAETFAGTGKQHESLSDAQSDQLYRNIEQLKFAWFSDRVSQYSAMPKNERRGFLKEQIRIVHLWADLMIEHDLVSESSASADASELYELFFDDVESWVAKLSKSESAAGFTAVQDALHCWLSVESLEQQSMSTRRELAERIVIELDHSQNVDYGYEELGPDEREQFASNIELLMEAWFYGQAERLAAMKDKSSREAFADDLLLRMYEWKFIELLDHEFVDGEKGSANPSISSMTKVTEMATRWIDRAPPDHKQQLQKLYSILTKRVFRMIFQGR